MTSQTRHYIQIADLLALRCDCKSCGASLSLAMKEEAARSLENCPACGKAWAQGENQKQIGLFLLQVESLRLIAKTVAFNPYLEISGPDSSAKD